MKAIKTIIILFCFSISINGQIPNAGFESWADETTPGSWITNNFLSAWTPVTRSTSAYTGTYAAKLEIFNFNGIPMNPTLSVTFPVGQTYGSLNGYYQLHQVNSNEYLGILTYYFANGTVVAARTLDLDVATSTYLPFSLNLDYEDVANPDSVWIQLIVLSSDNNDAGFGAYALVDDLSLGITTDIELSTKLPSEYSLEQNYPNPFNPTTTISYSIPAVITNSAPHQNVNLTIYDLLGKEVKNIVNGYKEPGNYEVTFDATSLSSGIYYYTLSTSSFVQTKKMLLIK